MTDATINTDGVPLAITQRLAALDGKLAGVKTQNDRDVEEIAGLRERITKIKDRIATRDPDLTQIIEQREMLLFAVKAYQDEAPKLGSLAAGLAPPFLSAPPIGTTPLKEKVYDAVRSAGYPIKATEIATTLGLKSHRNVAPILGVLSSQHRIVEAPEGGWMAAPPT